MTANKNNKRMVIFTQNALGGTEKVSIEIAKMLIADGWSVVFVICDFSLGAKINRLADILPKEAKSLAIFNHSQIGRCKDMYKAINQMSPDVVFCSHMHINQRLLLLSTLFPNIRFIVRNDNNLSYIKKYKRYTLKFTYKFADAVITQTKEMENELINLGIDKKKIVTLQNPLNINDIVSKANNPSPYNRAKDDIIFVAVGRISHQKGFDILIDAFNIVNKKLSQSVLYIVGNTSYEGGLVYRQLENQVKSCALENKVKFVGHQANPYNYIKNADVFVLSSRFEGLPNVLIEAQSLGVPCAAVTCIPIISRIIEDGQNGCLAQPENPVSLAEAMINATELKDIKMTYRPSASYEFLALFNKEVTSNKEKSFRRI